MRNVRFTTAIRLASALLGVFCFSAFSLAGINVSDLVLELGIVPSGSTTAVLEVENVGEETENVSVTAADWWVEPDGTHRFLEAGTLERSLTPYMTFSPVRFRLAPGETQQVRITVKPPADAKGTLWGMLFVESEGRPQDTSLPEVRLQVQSRFGVKVYGTVTGSEQQIGRITRLEVLSTEGGIAPTLHFQNLGNAALLPSGWFEIRNVQGQPIWRTSFSGRTVLPEATLHLTEEYDGPALTVGQYLLLGVVDYGGERLLGGQVVMSVE